MPTIGQTPALSVPERGLAAFLVPDETGISVVSDLGRLQPGTDQQPVHVYLESLAPGSQRTMRAALCTALAVLLERDTIPAAEMQAFPWQELRYQHTAADRSQA